MTIIKSLLPDLTFCINNYEGAKNTNDKACAVNRLVQTLFQMSHPIGGDTYKTEEEMRAIFFANWFNANEQDFEAKVIDLAAYGEQVKKGYFNQWESTYEG